MRLDALEREALKYALNDFNGDVYLFGSRIDDTKRGGDIDILLVPKERTNTFKPKTQDRILERRMGDKICTNFQENRFKK